jgi:ABC-type multidrug transport system ATPase subunit
MLLVEQNAEMALQLADRVYVIDHGTVVFDGTPARLRAERKSRLRIWVSAAKRAQSRGFALAEVLHGSAFQMA